MWLHKAMPLRNPTWHSWAREDTVTNTHHCLAPYRSRRMTDTSQSQNAVRHGPYVTAQGSGAHLQNAVRHDPYVTPHGNAGHIATLVAQT